MDYGCWFSGAIGSGIFLRVDNGLWFTNRVELERGLPGVLDMPTDCLYARETAKGGYDSLVLPQSYKVYPKQAERGAPRSEIVAVHRECMVRSSPLPHACPPAEGQWSGPPGHFYGGEPAPVLRTGWNADIPCNCSESWFLNCGHVPPYAKWYSPSAPPAPSPLAPRPGS
mmetsp:Transcript_34847/g.103359  ORF Transcript_34847/g.103359 Transcript_34847/m.103359 type:complete len:170 (-) Transcript_34847:116-625(-)